MEGIKKILVPTDFSDCAYNATRFAVLFADKYAEPLTIELLTVVYPEAEPVDFPTFSESATRQKVEWANHNIKEFSDTILAQLQPNHTLQRVPHFQSCVEIGTTPSSVISRMAQENDVDIVIMGTQGENSAIGQLLGTTASGTIRKSEKPTLVIPEGYKMPEVIKLSYATDLTTTDPYHIWELSKFFEPFSIIMRVIHINNETLQEKTEISMKNLESFFAEQLPSLQITFHNIPGTDVAEGLKEFNEEWDINLLVLYRKHRGFFDRLFHKSVTKQVVLQPEIPTLIIPD